MAFSRQVFVCRLRKRKLKARRLLLEPLEDRRLLAAQPAGDEFLVNPYTRGRQITTPGGAAVDTAANGDSVVVFHGRGPQDPAGVFAQRIDASGASIGDQLTISPSPFGWQDEATVSVADNGDFVVAWSGWAPRRSFGIFARRFHADGTPATGEIQVHQSEFGLRRRPAVAIKPDGSFVVAWEGRGQGDSFGIFLRLFDAAGQALGPELNANTMIRGSQNEAAIAVAPDGSFVVAWSGRGEQGGDGIFFRRFAATGDVMESEVRVNSTTHHPQAAPSIAMDPAGGFVIVWEGRGAGDRSGIFLRRFSADGLPSGPEELVNTTVQRTQSDPVVAMARDGSSVVTWSSDKQDGSRSAVIVQQLDPAGRKLGGELIVNTTTVGAQQAGSVSLQDNGDFLVVWSGRGVGDGWGVFARRFVNDRDEDTAAPAITAGLARDTGTRSDDGITSDPAVSGSLIDDSPIASFTLTIPELGAAAADILPTWQPATGAFALDRQAVETAFGMAWPDGSYTIQLQAADAYGNLAAPVTLELTLDTSAPTAPGFDLAAASDSAPAGDLATTTSIVTLVGHTDPYQTVELLEFSQLATADAAGAFTLWGVPLALGNNTLTITAGDLAGNSASVSRNITRLPSAGAIVLAEGERFLTEHRVTIPLSHSQGSQLQEARTLRFDLATDFDTSAAGSVLEDALFVYLVDSQDASRTLLDRGANGTALFMLAGDRVEFAPGTVRFDGTTVEIDVTSLADSASREAELVFQLLGSDDDDGTQVEITNLTNLVDSSGIASVPFPVDHYLAARGAAVELTAFTESPDLRPLISNIRVDAATGRLAAELRIANQGPAIGRHAVVSFPDLQAGVSLVDPSGSAGDGTPYISMHHAIPGGGLPHGATSDGVLIAFDNPSQLRFPLRPRVLAGPPNRAPTLAPMESLLLVPGQVVELALDTHDPDGDPLTTSIRSAADNLPAGQVAGGVLRMSPSPLDLGTYDLTVTVSDGVLSAEQSFQLVVAEDTDHVTRISGVVLGTDGAPLAGVPVSLSRLVTMTDLAGRFKIRLPSTLLPTESFDLEIPPGDPFFDPLGTAAQTIDFRRARYDLSTGTDTDNPRRHPNLVSSFLDASTVYGSDAVRAAALRSGSGGRLKVSSGPDGDLLPLNNAIYFPDGPLENDSAGTVEPSTLFVAGDVRASENPALSALHTLFVREHNRLADTIAASNPTLDDEQVYQRARSKVIALLQHITYQEYLPVLLGSGAIPDYAGYDPDAAPEAGVFFTTAAFRIGHSQMVSQLLRLDASGDESAGGHLSLREAFFTSQPLQEEGINTLLRGLLAQPAQRTDLQVIDDLRNFLFGPPGSGGMDLPAMTVQRGREMGLPSYIQARIDFGLPPIHDFSDITSNVTIQTALRDLYGTVDKIDPFVGGLAEDPVDGGLVGPLFHQAIAEQFRAARDGDRFWYENAQFTQTELNEIRATTLADLIARNTGVAGLAGNLFTSGTIAGGPSAGGSASSQPAAEFRSLDGSGNNLLDPQAGAAGRQLRLDARLNYEDGIAAPNGSDRPAAREVSNALFAQAGSVTDPAGFNALGIFWGQFLSHDLALTPTGTSDTLKIHGDGLILPDKQYPFVAEKLQLLLERDIYENAANEIARPIYLPAIDTAHAVTVNPAETTIVTTAALPHAQLTIAANTLESRDGQRYAGQISITEVPRDFTPAALPADALPDVVVTIQPAEMIFTTPAPLTLPNRAGYPAGETFDLMSINPVTGEFDVVGRGLATGTQIRTIDGGVRNSSWHFFRRRPPELEVDPLGLAANEMDGCSCDCPECEATVETGSRVELHSGAYIEYHDLVGYQSQGQTHSWRLTYDSKRGNPQSIVHFAYENVVPAADRRLGASITWAGAGTAWVQSPNTVTAPNFEHYWTIPVDGNFEAALLADMRNVPSGSYNILLRSGLVQYIDGEAFGVSNTAAVPVEVVNSTHSEFGAGWGLAGLQGLVVNGDGSVLLIDGDGSEMRFTSKRPRAGNVRGIPFGMHGFNSPPGDFSTLEFVADDGIEPAHFVRTFPNQTVYRYQVSRSYQADGITIPVAARLQSMRDRNGNETRFQYNTANRLTKIVDPVGLETVFQYAGSRVVAITEPGGRTTDLAYDAAGNLIRIRDPDGTQRQFEYDQNHRLTAETTKRGFRELVQYDSAGRVQKTVRRDGAEFQIAPLQTQQLIRYSLTTDHESPPAAPERMAVSSLGFGDAAILDTTTLNRLGLAQSRDGSGRVYQSLLDQEGQEILRRDGEGLVASHQRSSENQIVRSVSGRGFVTLYEYDERGNLLSITDDETLSDKAAEYLFDSGLDIDGRVPESNGGGATLSTIGYFGDAPGPFRDDQVFGTTRQVYAFAAGQGLALTTTDLIPADNYAIELVFQYDEVDGTRHLIDFNDRRGGAPPLAVIDGQLGFSPTPTRRGGHIVAGQYVHVVLTRASETDEVVGYVDGQEVFRFIDVERYLTVTSYDQLSFFAEFRFPYQNGHISSGKAALVRVYENPLSPGQVRRLADDPFAADFAGLDKTVFTYDATFNQRTSMTDQLGRQTLYEVDPHNGNLLSVTQVVGQPDTSSGETDDIVTAYTYFPSGLVDTMTDPLGRVTDYDYDQFERLVQITYAVGTADEAAVQYEFDAAGNLTASIDENGNRTEHVYDALNRVTKTIEPNPAALGAGLPTSPPAPTAGLPPSALGAGHPTSPTALGAGLPTSPTTEFTYDAAGNLLQQTDALGNTAAYTYDSLDRPITTTDALHQVSRFTYDESDNVLSTVDRLGRETRFVYDSRNRLVEVIDPLGHRERLAYDRDDNVIRRTDKNGNVTTYRYSARNLLIQSTDALAGVSTWRYDRANNLLEQTDELNRTTAYEYDQLDRRIKTIQPDPDGPVQRPGIAAEYRFAGDLAEQSGGTGLEVQGVTGQFVRENVFGAERDVYQFPRGSGVQLTTTDIVPSDQYSIELVFRFDNVLGYQRVLDFAGLASDNGLYVQSGQLRFYSHAGIGGSIVAGQYVHVVLTRDSNGTLKGYVDGQLAFETVDFARLGVIDNLGDRLGLFVDDGIEETSGAIALLRLYATPLAAGQIQSLVADPFVAELPWPSVTTGLAESPVTRLVYDKADQIVQVIDPLGNVTNNVYDARDRLIQRIDPDPDGSGPQVSPVTTFTYDAGNRLTATSDPLNRVTLYEYDGLDRPVRIIQPDPDGPAGPDLAPITMHTYDALDNLLATTDALGNTTHFEYDALYRRTRTIEPDPDGGGPDNTPTTEFMYDAESQLLSIRDPLGRVTSYEYDLLGRQIQVTQPDPDGPGPLLSPVTRYTYDAAGNQRTIVDPLGNTTAYEYDPLHRLVRVISADPDGGGPQTSPITVSVYDAADQLVSIIDPLQRATLYDYDNLGRVIRTIAPDPDPTGPDTSPVTTNAYDAVGNLVAMTDALGNTTRYEYDNLYRRTTVIEADPDGPGPLASSISVSQYDLAGQLIAATDALHRTTRFHYDDLGRVVAIVKPDPDQAGPLDAPVTTYGYDAMNNAVSMTDALGNTTRYDYDHLYRPIRVIHPDPDGAGPLASPVMSSIYDAAGQLLVFRDPLNRETSYKYDGLGRVVEITEPDPDRTGPLNAPVTTLAYDAIGNELSITDPLGNTTWHQYDNLYRRTRTTEPDPDGPAGPATAPITAWQYDAANQLLTTTDPLGRVTVRDYDGLGRLVRITRPDPDGAGPSQSPVFQFAYDAMNNELSMTDALGNTTQYEYDNQHRRTRIIEADPDGLGPQTSPVTSFRYDAENQVLASTDPLNRTTSFVYDDLGRKIRMIEPDPDGPGPAVSPVVSYDFDAMDNVRSMDDALGNVTRYAYDNLYRLVSITAQDPDGGGPLSAPVTSYTYDTAGQQLTQSDPLGRITLTEYDDLGRTVRVIELDPDAGGPLVAPVTSYTYDAVDNQLSMTDALGYVTRYEYDRLYRLTARIDEDLDGAGPLARPVTSYQYDLVDNLLSISDPAGNTTAYTYDQLDRQVTATIDLGAAGRKTRVDAYDAMDNLIRTTDRNGRITEFDFDHLHRRIGERWLDGQGQTIHTLSFTFDAADQLLAAADVTAAVGYDYEYDLLGRPLRTTVDNQGLSATLASAYNAEDLRTELLVSIQGTDDFRNRYQYDGLLRQTRVEQSGQSGGAAVAEKRVDFAYDPDSQFHAIERYADLAADHPVATTQYRYDGIGRLSELAHSNPSDVLHDYQFVLDAAHRLTSIDSSVDGLQSFRYDHGHQLTSATHTAQPDEAYAYDENGNRTGAGYQSGPYNRLVSDGEFNYEYDAEGNRTRRIEIATGAVTEYQWDHRNRLVGVIERSSDQGPATRSVVHTYDTFNRWVGREVDVDGDGPAAAESTRYFYDGQNIVLATDAAGHVAHRYLWGPAVDQVLADQDAQGDVLWPLGNHQGTINDLVDSSGAVINHRVFDSYGNIASETDPAVDHLFAYTGRPFDNATGLQNNLNRWYDARTGGWMKEDPIGFEAGDSNLYRYVGNSPWNATDPDGLDYLAMRGNRVYRVAEGGGFDVELGVAFNGMVRLYANNCMISWPELKALGPDDWRNYGQGQPIYPAGGPREDTGNGSLDIGGYQIDVETIVNNWPGALRIEDGKVSVGMGMGYAVDFDAAGFVKEDVGGFVENVVSGRLSDRLEYNLGFWGDRVGNAVFRDGFKVSRYWGLDDPTFGHTDEAEYARQTAYMFFMAQVGVISGYSLAYSGVGIGGYALRQAGIAGLQTTGEAAIAYGMSGRTDFDFGGAALRNGVTNLATGWIGGGQSGLAQWSTWAARNTAEIGLGTAFDVAQGGDLRTSLIMNAGGNVLGEAGGAILGRALRSSVADSIGTFVRRDASDFLPSSQQIQRFIKSEAGSLDLNFRRSQPVDGIGRQVDNVGVVPHSIAAARHAAFAGDLNAINATSSKLGMRAMRMAGGDAAKAERVFEGYMQGVANRLQRTGAKYGVEIQPAANANGRVWNFIQFRQGAEWTEKLYAFPGSRRLDAGIVDLPKAPNEFGLRPLVSGFDITLNRAKPNIVQYYQEYFGNIPIFDLRLR